MKCFLKTFILVLILFCARIQIRTNVYSFLIGNGSTMMTLEKVHRFFSQIPCFGLWNDIFFPNFCFGARFILCQNSDSHKFLHLFDWRWVNEQDFVGGSSFFCQIPSFRPPKWNFFRKFSFWCSFYFTPKFKFAQIYAAFQLVMGQRWWILRRFIIFSVKFLVLDSEMVSFS